MRPFSASNQRLNSPSMRKRTSARRLNIERYRFISLGGVDKRATTRMRDLRRPGWSVLNFLQRCCSIILSHIRAQLRLQPQKFSK